ncbi:hypothetical protein [Pseudalkalibacillus berkeleyi]|uniref:Uncharacterized protein n=1 Tax=Pseudalkalibacillus berkeleyi TaxID=1069813 RepID=A0ABS9H113_9BACL|nr:hypothetical protein [Pseudalkalibacillus berkeleyi]MCF6137497.1 hypothetical protein [Pseudalkalibacillus berkeleyi]
MPQFLFEVTDLETLEKESDDQQFINKVATVDAEVIDKQTGNTICKGSFEVKYNQDGVYPSVKMINSIDAPKYIKTELLFRSKRYIKRMRRWL